MEAWSLDAARRLGIPFSDDGAVCRGGGDTVIFIQQVCHKSISTCSDGKLTVTEAAHKYCFPGVPGPCSPIFT